MVVLSGFQWTIWRIYTTWSKWWSWKWSCFIRISMNNLKDIHNLTDKVCHPFAVVLSGFQWTIWRIYTTRRRVQRCRCRLFYQDFNEQFEGYTQHPWIMLAWRWVVLSGFQWTIWRIYTTESESMDKCAWLFYQDFNEQFEGYTQQLRCVRLAKDVVLSGFQWTIWRIYTTQITC